MKNTYNKFDKNDNKKLNNEAAAMKPTYGYYSRVLQKPFDTLDELNEAEATFYESQRAKEVKAATKKSDAAKVEEAFKALNAARKAYKDDLIKLTADYADSLKKMKAGFENAKATIHERLATAETTYEEALRAFTEKYPEGYHLTLKDGDFETTIRSSKNVATDAAKAFDIFDMLFRL